MKTRKRFWVLGLKAGYLGYMLALFVWMQVTWPSSVPAQIGWMFHFWTWLMVPNLLAGFIAVLLDHFRLPGLGPWFHMHPRAWITEFWGVTFLLGYFQWFVALPWLWGKLHRKAVAPASTMLP